MDKYLGHTLDYWLELQREADTLGVTRWLEEIAELRAKVSFYEKRIDELATFKTLSISAK